MSRPAIEQLDAQHRAAQAGIALAVARAIVDLWTELIDPLDIASSTARWLARALALVLRHHGQSVDTAMDYLTEVRALELFRATPIEIPRPEMSSEQVRSSLIAVGPRQLLIQLAKVPEPPPLRPPDPGIPGDESRYAEDRAEQFQLKAASQQMRAEAQQMAPKRVAAAAVRHVVNGARDATENLIAVDPQALGWARITAANPCYFCAMLASRGPVYEEDSFDASDFRFSGVGDIKVHDGDVCTLRPVFTTDSSAWPESSLRYSKLWSESTSGKSGRDAAIAFRRAYEMR